MINRELGPIRPPSEQNSLLIRVTRGCHWNRCTFCGLYKGMKFSIRPIEDILQDIKECAVYYGEQTKLFESCFLQDGDAFNIPTKDLLIILQFINKKFPALKTITTYARCDSILKKNEVELKALSQAGLNHLYRGIESGSDIILKNIHKGLTSDDIIRSGLMCKRAKISLSEFTLLGIGGKALSVENAVETARVINAVNPEYIRVHHTAFKPNTKLGRDVQKGLVQLQSEEEIIKEQKLFIEHLNNINGYYINEHAVNLLLEVRGKLPNDKNKMLAIIDNYLSMTEADKLNFAVGRRLGRYYALSDMRNTHEKAIIDKYIADNTDIDFTKLCNSFRSDCI